MFSYLKFFYISILHERYFSLKITVKAYKIDATTEVNNIISASRSCNKTLELCITEPNGKLPKNTYFLSLGTCSTYCALFKGTTIIEVYGKLRTQDVTGLTFSSSNNTESTAVKRELKGKFVRLFNLTALTCMGMLFFSSHIFLE